MAPLARPLTTVPSLAASVNLPAPHIPVRKFDVSSTKDCSPLVDRGPKIASFAWSIPAASQSYNLPTPRAVAVGLYALTNSLAVLTVALAASPTPRAADTRVSNGCLTISTAPFAARLTRPSFGAGASPGGAPAGSPWTASGVPTVSMICRAASSYERTGFFRRLGSTGTGRSEERRVGEEC